MKTKILRNFTEPYFTESYRGKCCCGFHQPVKPISGEFLSMCDVLIEVSVDLTVPFLACRETHGVGGRGLSVSGEFFSTSLACKHQTLLHD